MTTDELNDALALLQTTWSAPPRMPDGSPAAYRLMVGHLPFEQVMAGMALCAERDPKWRPSPAELRAACITATGTGQQTFATPDEAWQLVQQAIRLVGCSVHDPAFADRHQAAIDWLREQDESVAAWAARRGLCGPGSLGAEPVLDPEIGGAVRHRLGQEHGDVVALAKERVLLGGRAFVDADFQLTRGTPGGMGELLEHLRPARKLAAGPTPDIEAA